MKLYEIVGELQNFLEMNEGLEDEQAYKDTLATDCNANIVLTNGKFPSLKNGANQITISGLTKLEITPRWWIV